MNAPFALALLAAVTALGACDSGGQREAPRAEREHRVIDPPGQNVRPLPPHAIRGDGVGPYKLGATLAELTDQLPSGPRNQVYEISGVVQRELLRAEDDAILIGGEQRGRASFVAVVGGEVARTESGIHVGSTREELATALGPLITEPNRARDPRVAVPAKLRNARVVTEADHIAAIVVVADDAAAPAVAEGCARPVSTEPKIVGACLTAAGELVAIDGEEIAVRAQDDHPIANVRVAGLVWAAALRFEGDARDELVAISRTEGAEQRVWTLTAFRLDGGKLVRSIEPSPLYQLTSANARWIGAELRDVDLYLELSGHADAIEVGGLLTTRAAEKLRDVVVISPLSVPRHRAKAATAEQPAPAGVPEASDAGVVPAPDGK